MCNVYHSGSTPSDIVIVGEKPGRIEYNTGIPFSGASGEILSMILAHCGDRAPYHKSSIYITNLDKHYEEDNPDPTYEDILAWGGVLQQEIIACQPKVIICAGRFSSWWFLGGWRKWGMRTTHGRVCQGGELFDAQCIDDYPESDLYNMVTSPDEGYDHSARAARWLRDLQCDYESRANGALVVPCFHPANALPDRDPKGDMMGVVWRDFDTAIRAYELSKGGLITTPCDTWRGRETYIDATGRDVASYIADVSSINKVIAVDTEDTEDPSVPWSVQICSTPGYALTLRIDQPDAQVGIDAIQRAVDQGYKIVVHFAIHDLPVLRKLHIDVSRVNITDTGYMLYLLGEPQSLKVAAWRHCAMFMEAYSEVVGNAGRSAQMKYLIDVVIKQYPSPGKLSYIENNGQLKGYSPQSPTTKAERIIKDLNKGKKVDIWERWHGVAGSGHKARVIRDLYKPVVEELGAMPRGYLKDIDRNRAVRYECRDPDATLRLHDSLLPKLARLNMS